jgi:hypothetical protein
VCSDGWHGSGELDYARGSEVFVYISSSAIKRPRDKIFEREIRLVQYPNAVMEVALCLGHAEPVAPLQRTATEITDKLDSGILGLSNSRCSILLPEQCLYNLQKCERNCKGNRNC